MNTSLRKQLLRMASRDQKMRKSGRWDTRVDRTNTRELKKLIDKFGWPDERLVGKQGAQAAWLIAQHADHAFAFQKKCLELIHRAGTHVSPSHAAYLTDRIRVHEGKRQVYGTQFYKTRNNRIVPRPIQRKNDLDKRRKKIGLESFEGYRKKLIKNIRNLDRKRGAGAPRD